MAKSPSKQTQLNTTNFIPSVLILAFLSVGFIPNWEAVDKIAPQWLYLSILNLICGLFFFSKKNFFKSFFFSVELLHEPLLCCFCHMGSPFIFLCDKPNRGISKYCTTFQHLIYVPSFRNIIV